MDVQFALSFVEQAVHGSKMGQSKCNEAVMAMEGMSGRKTRHLYNNMCSLVKPDGSPTRYLEIGCWKGSSTAAALYGNHHVRATVIDNWSEFHGPRNSFFDNMAAILGPKREMQVIEEDAFCLATPLEHAPYDIYLYDGEHKPETQERAITHLWDHMADTCIIMIDDYNWPEVQKGTLAGLEAIKARGGHVVAQAHIRDVKENDPEGYWNGCGIFLVARAAAA